MQLVCVSRGSLIKGQQFAGALAKKLGFRCISREEVYDLAAREGIAVGKLEMAMVRPSRFDERLMLEKEHYQAFVTKMLCEHSLAESVIYHGRTGHLMLANVSHVLRLRVVADMESRIISVMQRLRLPRNKAREYVEQVEEDRDRWSRTMHGVNWSDPSHYDLTVNLEQVTVESASTALCAYLQLPEFQTTPASRRAMEDLLLASRARLALARDERTYGALFSVRASNGALTVTYAPKYAASASHAESVLAALSGVGELHCTMAATNILWLQERFQPQSPALDPVVRVAKRWNAAVELLQLVPTIEGDGEQSAEQPTEDAASAETAELPMSAVRERHGGVEDDDEKRTEAAADDPGLRSVYDELVKQGVSGSTRSIPARAHEIAHGIDRSVPYSLVVVGDVFLDKAHAARVRMTRELISQMNDTLKVPVVKSDELKAQYFVGPRQFLKLALFLAMVVVFYLGIFSNQVAVLRYTTPEGTLSKAFAALVVLVFIPVLAYTYGTVTRTLLKLVKIE